MCEGNVKAIRRGGGRELPPWARIMSASGLDGTAVRDMLEARPKAA